MGHKDKRKISRPIFSEVNLDYRLREVFVKSNFYCGCTVGTKDESMYIWNIA
jgi:hypothetical protein